MKLLDRYLLLCLGKEKYQYSEGWKTSFTRIVFVGLAHSIVLVVTLGVVLPQLPIEVIATLAVLVGVGILALGISTIVGMVSNDILTAIAKKRGL